MTGSENVRGENRIVIAHLYTATAAIALGAIFGVFQGFARTGAFGAPGWFDYYRILTMHGVLMALVFTTFFITGLALFVTYRSDSARAQPLRRLVRLGAHAARHGDGGAHDP